MSREPPPLPGGHEVGQFVYFTGTSATVDHGPHAGHDRFVHGEQGEVTGPGTFEGGYRENGVKVLFPGNKGGIDCLLTELGRARP